MKIVLAVLVGVVSDGEIIAPKPLHSLEFACSA